MSPEGARTRVVLQEADVKTHRKRLPLEGTSWGVSLSPLVVTQLRSAGRPPGVSWQIRGGQDTVMGPVASAWAPHGRTGGPAHLDTRCLLSPPPEGRLTPWLPERTWV